MSWRNSNILQLSHSRHTIYPISPNPHNTPPFPAFIVCIAQTPRILSPKTSTTLHTNAQTNPTQPFAYRPNPSTLRALLIFCLLLLGNAPLFAQKKNNNPTPTLSNLRQQTLPCNTLKDTLIFDTLSIVPKSLQIKLQTSKDSQQLDSSYYYIDEAKPMLVWIKKLPTNDSLLLQYRVLPFNLTKTIQHKKTTQILKWSDDLAQYHRRFQIGQEQTSAANFLFQPQGLDYSGSIGRGISFGNNQDLVLNSNFNLQMAGKIGNDIELLAAMTDSNIPFQPEGNTQQLQEFDRIFIQIKRKNAALLLGDYDLKKPNAYFLNFTRRLQGAQVSVSQYTDKQQKKQAKISANGAIARGNYHRLAFNATEANQGPYKLYGANGETFIIVLSGSERVFVDGKRLTRGADNDYIIDYNTAEVTFTPHKLMTKDRRIVVEFEYADRNYLRSTLFAEASYNTPRFAVAALFFGEQDAKNQPIVNGSFTEQQRNALQMAGDNPQLAVIQSADSIAFSNDRILYQKIDTTNFAGIHDSVFVYSTNPQTAYYALIFTYLGENKGNYVLANTNANGRVYQWVAPDPVTGQKNGNYEPLQALPMPLLRQMYVFSGHINLTQQQSIHIETAISNKDANTLSNIDDNDNQGLACRAIYENTQKWGATNKQNQVLIKAAYEWTQSKFKAIEPFRAVEFGRDWNLNLNNSPADEHIASATIKYGRENLLDIQYELALQKRSNKQYEGWKHLWRGNYKPKMWNMEWNISLLSSKSDTTLQSIFWRPQASIARQIGKQKNKWTLGFKTEAEHNQIKTMQNDSLNKNSFFYYLNETYLRKNDSTAMTFELKALYRKDFGVKNNAFKHANNAFDINLQGGWNKNPAHQLNYSFSYRNMTVADSSISPNKSSLQTFLGELNHLIVIKKGMLRLQTQYQLGSGQRQQTQFYYQAVPNGTGTHVWRDDGDGIEEQEEFEIASANDQVFANYVQIVLPTTQYQATHILTWNQTFFLSPKLLWFNATKKIKRVISYLSWQSTISIRQETIAEQGNWTRFFPFVEADTMVTAAQNKQLKHTLFLNRNAPEWECSAYISSSETATLLTSGTDSRQRNENGINAKIALSKKFLANANIAFGNSKASSQSIDRNFNIAFWNTEPAISFLPSKQFRITAAFKYKHAVNLMEINTSQQAAVQQQWSVDTRWGSPLKSSIGMRFAYTNVRYNGSTNTPAAYTLLDGFQNGNNYSWTINFDTRLSQNLQLSMGYDGRQSGTSPLNHIGRASLKAIF